jgi:hypothetical protein
MREIIYRMNSIVKRFFIIVVAVSFFNNREQDLIGEPGA